MHAAYHYFSLLFAVFLRTTVFIGRRRIMNDSFPSRLAFFAFVALAFAVIGALPLCAQANGGDVENFLARSDGRAITLEWRSGQEINITLYEIERSPANQNDFKRIGSVPARGSQQSYRFVDENALAAAPSGGSSVQSGSVYVYRLKIIDTNGKATYSNTISVSHTISSVRRTWGMIKEMFR